MKRYVLGDPQAPFAAVMKLVAMEGRARAFGSASTLLSQIRSSDAHHT